MDSSHFVLALIVFVLAAALVLMFQWHRKRTSSLAASKQHVVESAHRAESQFQTQHHRSLREQRSAHETEFERYQQGKEAELERLNQDLDNTHADLTRLHDQYSRTVGIGDRTSRRDIIDTCQESDINAALLTNIVFSPINSTTGERYYSQIDHLLVASTGIAVIENKYWSGLVFDGVPPQERINQLKGVFEKLELSLSDGEVLQIRDSEGNSGSRDGHKSKSRWLKMEIRDSPHLQAQKQAKRVRELLNSKLVNKIRWIETCVYYSYKGAAVHHGSSFGARGRAQTTIASTPKHLGSFVENTMHKDRVKIDVEAVVNALSGDSGDIVGFGKWRNHWGDELS